MPGPVVLGCLCMLAAASAARAADDASTQPRFLLEPRLQVSETFSDNYNASATQAESDLITRVTAGLGWRARSGALRGYLDYALTGVVYARHSDRNDLQNALSANVTADLIDNRLQLQSSASITRSAISAFGVQPGGSGDANSNVTETRTLQIAPTLRGPIGSELVYVAKLGHAITSSANAGIGDSTASTASVHLEPSTRARLGWSLDASHLTSAFKQGRTTQNDRLYGGLSLSVDALDLQLTATGGAERSNLLSLDRTSTTTWGVGAVWVPSPNTRVAAEYEDRFFGSSHALSVEHRTARTIFRLRSSRSLSTSGSQVAGVQGQAFDLFNGQPGIVAQFPDAAQREAFVNDLLRRLNIDPNRVIDTGFLRSAASLQDLLSVSAAWTGPRDTATLTLTRTKSSRADSLSSAVDDFSLVGEIDSTTLSLDLAHRLTPTSTLTLVLGVQRSRGTQSTQTAQIDLSNRQTQADLLFTTRLSPDINFSSGLRRTHYNNAGLRSYDETALTVNVVARF